MPIASWDVVQLNISLFNKLHCICIIVADHQFVFHDTKFYYGTCMTVTAVLDYHKEPSFLFAFAISSIACGIGG